MSLRHVEESAGGDMPNNKREEEHSGANNKVLQYFPAIINENAKITTENPHTGQRAC
jgi:hypothetical protein